MVSVAADSPAADRPTASIFTAPTKILPRVESGGVLRIIGANLIAYTRRPTVNLVLLLLAGTLLVGMGFVIGSARKEPTLPTPPDPQAVDRSALRAPVVRTAAPTAIASAPIAAIAVSSLPVAPSKEQAGALRAIPAASAGHVSSPEFPLPPDRPPVPADKAFVPPVRNPGF
jgi:hypothetical protein